MTACASPGDFFNDHVDEAIFPSAQIESGLEATFSVSSDEPQLREAIQASKDEAARVARFASFKRMENIASRRKREAKLERKKTEPTNRISVALRKMSVDPSLCGLVMVKNPKKQPRSKTSTNDLVMVMNPKKEQRVKTTANAIQFAQQQERKFDVIPTDQRNREWLGSMAGDVAAATRSKRGVQRDERKHKMRAAAKEAAMQKAKSRCEHKKRLREKRAKVYTMNEQSPSQFLLCSAANETMVGTAGELANASVNGLTVGIRNDSIATNHSAQTAAPSKLLRKSEVPGPKTPSLQLRVQRKGGQDPTSVVLRTAAAHIMVVPDEPIERALSRIDAVGVSITIKFGDAANAKALGDAILSRGTTWSDVGIGGGDVIRVVEAEILPGGMEEKEEADTDAPATQQDVTARQKSLTLEPFVRKMLENSAEQVSAMSQSSKQFIYELVQNVDDTPHRATLNTLTFALCMYDPQNGDPLTHPYLLLLSSQDGFTKGNLDAICGVSMSFKSSAPAPSSVEVPPTGKKGIGFKSVFRLGVPKFVSKHVRGGEYVHFELPDESRKMRGGNESVKYMTPFELDPETLDLIKRLVDDIASVVPTDGVDGFTKGTVLALELTNPDWNKHNPPLTEMLEDGDSINELEFAFLKRIRTVQFAVLTSKAEKNARGVTYKYENGDPSKVTIESFQIDALKKQDLYSSEWLAHCADVEGGGSRIKAVNGRFPLDESAHELLETFSFPRMYVALPTYNEAVNESTFKGFRFLLDADFDLNSGRTAFDEDTTNDWNSTILTAVGQQLLPAAIIKVLNTSNDKMWPHVYKLIPDDSIGEPRFKSICSNTVAVLRVKECVPVQGALVQTWNSGHAECLSEHFIRIIDSTCSAFCRPISNISEAFRVRFAG